MTLAEKRRRDADRWLAARNPEAPVSSNIGSGAFRSKGGSILRKLFLRNLWRRHYQVCLIPSNAALIRLLAAARRR